MLDLCHGRIGFAQAVHLQQDEWTSQENDLEPKPV
jgi:hypothetical protein